MGAKQNLKKVSKKKPPTLQCSHQALIVRKLLLSWGSAGGTGVAKILIGMEAQNGKILSR